MRAALYARVSSEEQVEGYSIDAQRRAFQALCEGRGWEKHREYMDEGKSARTEDISERPMFKQMMADAESRSFEVLVVHKLDRFSRNLRITLEYFDKLLKWGISFISINEQMDFTTPSGKVHLALLGAFAQYYSDNLSQETKKGWAERKAQGLYCGLLPFGAIKGEDGVPIPHPDTYPGLVMAFELAAQGKSDREIAMALNAAGYRTAGNQGARLFSNNTVGGILTNRFYLGYLPDGNSGWIKARHEAFIDEGLASLAQETRQRNATSSHRYCTQKARICSLSGITYCWNCKGRIHVACNKSGIPRLGCYNRMKGWDCPQKSASIEVYEEQIEEYLQTFHIPEDYQRRILEAHEKLQSAYSDTEKVRAALEARMERVKELYKWGDITREEYTKEKEQIKQELDRLTPPETSTESLKRLADFLANVSEAWRVADQKHRNDLARCLFQEIWEKDSQVVAVRPKPELGPFFELNYEEFVNKRLKKRPRGVSNPRSIDL